MGADLQMREKGLSRNNVIEGVEYVTAGISKTMGLFIIVLSTINSYTACPT